MRYFAEGNEESIAVTVVGQDGAIYQAGSPVRRAISVGIWGNALPPLGGGITRYKPIRFDILARDAVCAAFHRIERTMDWGSTPGASKEDITSAFIAEARQITELIKQARWSLTQHKDLEVNKGFKDGVLANTNNYSKVKDLLDYSFDAMTTAGDLAGESQLRNAEPHLAEICNIVFA